MAMERTACFHRGQIFEGEFEVIGDGTVGLVRVRYKGEVLEAPLRAALPEVTAHHLLKELVVLDIVKLKAAEDEAAFGRAYGHLTTTGVTSAGVHHA